MDACADLHLPVVVIDVIRAFTTAAWALARGATEILLVSTVDEALALKAAGRAALAIGEVNGDPPPGFDLGNSPVCMQQADVAGLCLVQRTGSGTQGAVRCINAPQLFATSFVCASATVQAVRRLTCPEVAILPTGHTPEGAEDIACAEYLSACLQHGRADALPYLERVRTSPAAQRLLTSRHPKTPPHDLEACVDLDRFDFAMPVQRRDGLLVLTKG